MSQIETLLNHAWQHVKADDDAGLLASERGMQASLYYHLRQLGRELVVVEPRLSIPERSTIPDLYVADAVEAWFIEIKFQNAGGQGIKWEDDFAKFAAIERALGANAKLMLAKRGNFEPVDIPALRRYLFLAIGDPTCNALNADWLRSHARRDKVEHTYCALGTRDRGPDRAQWRVEHLWRNDESPRISLVPQKS